MDNACNGSRMSKLSVSKLSGFSMESLSRLYEVNCYGTDKAVKVHL